MPATISWGSWSAAGRRLNTVSRVGRLIAAVLTYVRREWGKGAEPVTPDTVATVCDETSERDEPFTVPGLMALEP